jgi:hypothetical protein
MDKNVVDKQGAKAPLWEGLGEAKLTQYSHGAGCGCKIAPKILDEILTSNFAMPDNANLIVGNHSKDDAAVYDLGNGTALISTTDFFMPIVDDPLSLEGSLLPMPSVMCMPWAENPFWQLLF